MTTIITYKKNPCVARVEGLVLFTHQNINSLNKLNKKELSMFTFCPHS